MTVLVESLKNVAVFREGRNSGQRREATIIQEGWGSSGYYSREVLERDIPRIFPPGTHMYLDHPTHREDAERPERSVADLVGKTIGIPRMAGIDAVTEVAIYPHWVEPIDAMAEDIGLSIRAMGVTENGDAAGRSGPVVQTLTEGLSIDYVTHAGAGGKIGPLIESARQQGPPKTELEEARRLLEAAYGDKILLPSPEVGADALFEEALILAGEWSEDDTELQEAETVYDEFLERDVSKGERIALAKKGQAIPIKDQDGNIIGGRFPMANCEDVKAAAMSVGRTNMPDIKGFIKRVASKLSCPVPFKESGSGRVTKEDPMSDASRLSELEESVRQLTEAKKDQDKKITDLEEKSKKETERADSAEDALRLREAGAVVSGVVSEHEGLPKQAAKRAIEAALRGDLPTNSDGSLDKSALEERARTKVREEVEYIAEAAGRRVSGHGSSSKLNESAPNGNGSGSGSEKTALQEAFEARGLSESAAKAAAEGR